VTRANHKDYIVDRRQWGTHSKTGKQYLSGGGWMIFSWDGSIYVEGVYHRTKAEALRVVREARRMEGHK